MSTDVRAMTPVKAGKPSTLGYLPGLDGLRAISVVAVMLWHAELTWVSGGFLGVEGFFVISGYLITMLLMSEERRAGFIHLGRFWMRRARRLLPALYALLVAVCVFTMSEPPCTVIVSSRLPTSSTAFTDAGVPGARRTSGMTAVLNPPSFTVTE